MQRKEEDKSIADFFMVTLLDMQGVICLFNRPFVVPTSGAFLSIRGNVFL